jgi:hypothetical protein
LHPENETRMLSLTITDTRDQTAAVFRALAQETNSAEIDLTRWQALQTWLATGPNGVVIPFAAQLAGLVPPLAVRLRFQGGSHGAHALLHRASRQKDEQGRVIAEIEDYQVVRELVADLVAVGAEFQATTASFAPLPSETVPPPADRHATRHRKFSSSIHRREEGEEDRHVIARKDVASQGLCRVALAPREAASPVDDITGTATMNIIHRYDD